MLARLFLTSLLCALFALSASAQMTFTDYYLESIERAEEYTLDLVEVMPESKFDFKSTPEVSSFHDQVTHVIKNIGFLQTYITGDRDSPIRDLELNKNNKEELIANLKTAFAHLRQITKDLKEEELTASVDFFKEGVRMDKRGILLLIKNHLTLHQGQLIVYLRLNGLTPPKFNGY